MQNKISVYEEILAMEPGSKLFFPLAKMLVETGEYSKAEKILLQGLTTHPEYLEARLLLLDVLEHLGREDDALVHCHGMLDLLKKSKGFWTVWHRILAGNGESDTRMALTFVQASLQGNVLTWTDVFEQGLASVLGIADGGSVSAVKQADADPDAQDVMVEPEMQSTAVFAEDLVAGADVVLREDVSSADLVPESDASSVSEGGTEAICEPEDVLEQKAQSIMAPEHKPQVQPASIPESRDEVLVAEADLAGADVSVVEDISSEVEDVSEDGGDESFEPSQDADAEEVDDSSMDSGVRTRTMADLLMKQEEYAQAAVIYEKLWEESTPGTERRELFDALTAARGNMKEEAAGDNPQPSAGDGAMHGEDHASSEALRTLSALAERLEQRAEG